MTEKKIDWRVYIPFLLRDIWGYNPNSSKLDIKGGHGNRMIENNYNGLLSLQSPHVDSRKRHNKRPNLWLHYMGCICSGKTFQRDQKYSNRTGRVKAELGNRIEKIVRGSQRTSDRFRGDSHKRILLVCWIIPFVLKTLDMITTAIIISNGGVELNPFMSLLFSINPLLACLVVYSLVFGISWYMQNIYPNPNSGRSRLIFLTYWTIIIISLGIGFAHNLTLLLGKTW